MVSDLNEYSGDAMRGLYHDTKTAASKIRAKYAVVIARETAAVKEAFEDYVLNARLHDLASVQRIANDIGVARTSVYAALDSALERQGMTRADLASGNVLARIGAVVEASRKSGDVFRIRTLHRDNLHVTIPVGADPTGHEMQNVFLDPRQYRVLNVSRHENGAQPMMSGEAVDAWQAELDTPGSTLRNTVDKHNETNA
jgi:hypothetical protein